jgi:hypothetical protein
VGGAALPPAARQLGGQGVQALCPEPSEALQPHIDLPQGFGGHRVQTAGAVSVHDCEPVLPQHAQVLGDRRLGDPELGADDRGDHTGGLLAISQQFQDAAPDRVAQDIELVHAALC